jgi:plastocyanin
MARDDSVTRCAPMPWDVQEVTVPPKYDTAAPFVYDRRVPQLFATHGKWKPFPSVSRVYDQFFAPQRLTARVGQKLTWQFAGAQPHSVSVTSGPRGFSSSYLGNVSGRYSFTPSVAGTYRLTCLIHPTTMSQTVRVAGRSAQRSPQRRRAEPAALTDRPRRS